MANRVPTQGYYADITATCAREEGLATFEPSSLAQGGNLYTQDSAAAGWDRKSRHHVRTGHFCDVRRRDTGGPTMPASESLADFGAARRQFGVSAKSWSGL